MQQAGGLDQTGRDVATQYTTQGLSTLAPLYQAGRNDLTQNYAAGLQPFQTNYAANNAGQQMLGNALGINGQGGRDAATQAFQAGPGYQWQLDQGSQNILRNQAATGQLNSGATNLDLLNYGQGQANQQWQNWINALQPYQGAANTSAGGIGTLSAGLGNQLNASNMGQGNQSLGALQGLGTNLLNSYTGQGNMAYGANASMGNAQANADLANNNASANLWNLGGKLLGAGTNTVGGSALSNFLTSVLPSDERLKDDIEPVGELYDGQPVYKYRYKWDDPGMTRIGLMAQDVEETNPDAVFEIDGFKMVDYGRATNRAADLMRLAA